MYNGKGLDRVLRCQLVAAAFSKAAEDFIKYGYAEKTVELNSFCYDDLKDVRHFEACNLVLINDYRNIIDRNGFTKIDENSVSSQIHSSLNVCSKFDDGMLHKSTIVTIKMQGSDCKGSLMALFSGPDCKCAKIAQKLPKLT